MSLKAVTAAGVAVSAFTLAGRPRFFFSVTGASGANAGLEPTPASRAAISAFDGRPRFLGVAEGSAERAVFFAVLSVLERMINCLSFLSNPPFGGLGFWFGNWLFSGPMVTISM